MARRTHIQSTKPPTDPGAENSAPFSIAPGETYTASLLRRLKSARGQDQYLAELRRLVRGLSPIAIALWWQAILPRFESTFPFETTYTKLADELALRKPWGKARNPTPRQIRRAMDKLIKRGLIQSSRAANLRTKVLTLENGIREIDGQLSVAADLPNNGQSKRLPLGLTIDQGASDFLAELDSKKAAVE